VLTSEWCEALTDRVACDMLHRKFEHRGIKENDSLDGEDSRAQSVTPGPPTPAENVVECIAIIRCDAMGHGGSSQILQHVLAIDANAQEAVVDELGRFF
jgi:hypothetical protein